MSYLREIMQRLGARPSGAGGAPTAARPVAPLKEDKAYGEQLEHCSEAMLLYEWTWLELHLEDLRLCQVHEEMEASAGGARHVATLLATAQGQQGQLTAEFGRRGLAPRRLPHNVAPGEHAWELSNAELRAQWGLPTSTP